MPRATRTEKERKRAVVAKGLAAGKKPRAIAAEANCGTRHVERLAAEPATQFLIAEAMRPHHDKLRDLAKKAVAAVDRGLTARTPRSNMPMHEIQLRAVGRCAELLHLAQGDKPVEPDGNGLVTWQEFVLLYRSRTETRETA